MRRLGSGLVALLVAALVVGCGGSNPKPSPVSEAPSASASLSESESESESASPSGAPTMPAEAEGTTPESAEAFVRYYIDVFNYATQTGEVKAFDALAAKNCASCVALSTRISTIYAAGGSASGDLDQILSTRVKGSVVTARLKQLPQVTSASSGAPAKTAGPGTFRSRFTLAASGSGWLMQDWSLL